jgi:hypothetical protein
VGWQRMTGYGRRKQVETRVGRYRHTISRDLRANSLPGQQGEVAITGAVLTRITRVAKPSSVRRV